LNFKKNEIEKCLYIILTMNNTMISTSQFKDLNEFLAKHSAKNEKPGDSGGHTHTRIPDKDLNIYPGPCLEGRSETSGGFVWKYKHEK
jgi:hypothetical protein